MPHISYFCGMILAGILQSVEFYVMAAVVAAMIVALCARSDSRGPVREILLAGVISREGDVRADDADPRIELICNDDGSVLLRRHGVRGVNETGAVSLAIEVKGFDVKIRERVVTGRGDGEPVDTASFILDFMAREHYFISYVSDSTPFATSQTASLTLSNRPGNRVEKRLI